MAALLNESPDNSSDNNRGGARRTAPTPPDPGRTMAQTHRVLADWTLNPKCSRFESLHGHHRCRSLGYAGTSSSSDLLATVAEPDLNESRAVRNLRATNRNH